MTYITQDENSQTVAASNAPRDDAREEIALNSPELCAFVERLGDSDDVFETSDLKLIRVIEDVIDLLIAKNVICITELPPAVQTKLMERHSLRQSLNALHLFGDDDQGII